LQYLHGIITGPTRDIVTTTTHGVLDLHLDISSLQVSVKVHIKQCLSIHNYLNFGEHRGGQSHSPAQTSLAQGGPLPDLEVLDLFLQIL
jgi:hypothetical protein